MVPIDQNLSAPSDPYEFPAGTNALFFGLGSKMHFVGLVTVAIGIVSLAFGALRRDPGPVLAGVLYGLVGVWTARAGSQFRTVARTQGEDVRHLLAALDGLRKLYTLQYWVCLVVLVSALVLLITRAVH